MNRRLLSVAFAALIVMFYSALTGCVFFDRDESLKRFRTACVGLYDTISLLTAHRRAGRMTAEQWEKVNQFAEEGNKVCQDTAIEDYADAFDQVQDARSGIATVLKVEGSDV
ncbi:MAG: hypothetical protein ACR2RE_11240 [Geminicoccaceae bacterium]